MPVMDFDLKDGMPAVSVTVSDADAERFAAFMSRGEQAAQQRPPSINLPRFVNGVREFVLGQLHGNLPSQCYDNVRGVDPGWLARTVLESQRQPLPLEPLVYISESNLEAFHRFIDCSEAPEADGHDVPKEAMRALEAIGLVRLVGKYRYEATRYGCAIRSMTRQK